MESSVVNYYNNYNEDGRLMRKNRMPEYLTTMRYIEKYLTEGSRILEIGAGTGRYSLALADKGYAVDAVELVAHNIKIMKGKVKDSHNINIYEGSGLPSSYCSRQKPGNSRPAGCPPPARSR